jgi:hypothetical protein
MEEDKTKQVENQGLAIIEKMGGLVISDQESYDLALQYRSELQGYLERVEAFFEPMRVKAHEAYKEILNKKAEVVKPAKVHLDGLNASIGIFLQSQREKQRKLQEAEQERLNALAEKQHEREIKKLQKKGYDPESIEMMSQQAVVAPVAEVKPILEQGGISTREQWQGEVVDMMALIKFISKNKRYQHLLQVDQAELNKLARSMRQNLDLPGVNVISKTVVATKRR